MSVMSMVTSTVQEAAYGWRRLANIRVRDYARDPRFVRIYTGRSNRSPVEGEISLTFANGLSTWTTEVRMTPTEALRVAESLSKAARKVLEGEA